MSVLSSKVHERGKDHYLLSSLSAAFADSSTLPSSPCPPYPILSRGGTRVLLQHHGPPTQGSPPHALQLLRLWVWGCFWEGDVCLASPSTAGRRCDPRAGTRPSATRGRDARLLPSLSGGVALLPLVPATGMRLHVTERKIKLRGFA